MTRQGFTLLEVTMVTAILAVVMLAVGTVMHSASTELAVSVPETVLQTDMQRTIGRIIDELADAAAGSVNLEPDGRGITFMVPVNIDASWTGVGGNPPTYVPDWGARLGIAETSGGLNALMFVESTDSRVSPVSEATVVPGGLNININTEPTPDKSDVFAVGHLVLIYDPDGSFPTLTNDEVTRQLTGDWVVQVVVGTNYGGDVDADGNADPLFSYNATSKTVDINLWGLRVVRKEKVPLLVNDRMRVRLTNP